MNDIPYVQEASFLSTVRLPQPVNMARVDPKEGVKAMRVSGGALVIDGTKRTLLVPLSNVAYLIPGSKPEAETEDAKAKASAKK